MLSILLTVLKIIGIVILVILGLILTILLLVLFVPVRYRGSGRYQDGLFSAGLRASWLLHMVSVKGEYRNKQAFHIILKILGIPIYDNLKITGTKIKNKKVKSTKTKIENTGEIQAASEDNWPENDFMQDTVLEEADPLTEEHCDAGTGSKITADSDFQNKLADSSDEKLGIVQKIKIFFINFVNFFKNIKFTFDKVCDTMVKIKDNIKYYLKVLQLDSTKRAFTTCRKQLIRILGKVLPRKYRINLHLGFDDPAVMGEVLAVWGMFYPLHQGNINIQPEFEQSVAEGDFSFQGHVSVFVFVQTAFILFFDKDIKRLVKLLKREKD